MYLKNQYQNIIRMTEKETKKTENKSIKKKLK